MLLLRPISGGVAQLGERRLCKPEVVGSIPSASTSFLVVRMARPDDRRSSTLPNLGTRIIQYLHRPMDNVCAGFCGEKPSGRLPLLFVIVNMMLSGLRFNLLPWVVIGRLQDRKSA